MEIYINNAILHVIDNNNGRTEMSNQELDLDSDTCTAFITKHIKNLLNNPATKNATFRADSEVMNSVMAIKNGDVYFKDGSHQIGQRLVDIMLANVEIPAGDIIITQFEIKEQQYLAILKLNYKECYMHQIGESGNQIIKCSNVLPFGSGRVEEACLIPYDPMVLKIIEKPYPVNGETENYFSKRFLECDPELSKKEAVAAINDITEEINSRYFDDDLETAAKVRVALIEESIDEEGYVSITNVANKVFSENEEIKRDYIDMAEEAGIKGELNLGEKYVKQQFGVQKFKASNGIEIKFPAELSDDPAIMELINNGDGSVSITFKNLRKA